MPYLTAIKYAVVVAVIAAYSYTVYDFGRNAELVKWQKQSLDQRAELERLNKEAFKREEQNIALSQDIEIRKNDALQESARLNDKLRAALNRVPERTVCVNRSVPKNNSSGNIVDATPIEAALSDEFKEFLISKFRTADELGIYSETAHDWALRLCKLEGVVCGSR